MPYTPPHHRELVLRSGMMKKGGDLAFLLAHDMEEYRKQHGDSWQTFSDIIAAAEGALDEFKLQVVQPYEAKKREQNGRIFKPIK